MPFSLSLFFFCFCFSFAYMKAGIQGVISFILRDCGRSRLDTHTLGHIWDRVGGFASSGFPSVCFLYTGLVSLTSIRFAAGRLGLLASGLRVLGSSLAGATGWLLGGQFDGWCLCWRFWRSCCGILILGWCGVLASRCF